jgi:hypothetical protein
MDAVDFSQRHQQHVLVPKTHDFRQSASIMAGGFDPTDFADGNKRAFRFNHQPNDLFDEATVLHQPGLAHAPEQMTEAMGRR